jgi:hypothetical protein
MSGIWDTAETLIAMAGDADAAAALAREMAEDCADAKRRRESAYWLQVAWALAWLANPQPLIAPEAPPAPGAVVAPLRERRGLGVANRARTAATVHRLDFAAKLPKKRTSVGRLKRALRDVVARHRAKPRRRHPRKPEPNGQV